MSKLDEEKFCIFGGSDMQTIFNDVFIFSTKLMSWTKIKTSGQQPLARAGHSAVIHAEKIIIFGGANSEGEIYEDMYSLDTHYRE